MLRIEVFNSVREMPANDWQTINGENVIFTSFSYLSALEQSKPAGMQFRYVIVYDSKMPVATLCFQLLDVANKDLDGVLNLKDKGWLLQNLNKSINRLLFKCQTGKVNFLICCGSFFVSGEYGINVINRDALPAVIQLLPEVRQKITDTISNASVCGWMVKDFYNNTKVDQPLLEDDFFELPMDPEMILYIREQWHSFEEYLASLTTKYRVKANSVIRKIEDVDVVALNAAEVLKYGDELIRLYLNIQQKATVQMARVNILYFEKLLTIMPEKFYVKVFFKESKVIAFYCGFHHAGHHEAHFIGIDYSLNKTLSLYQNILYRFIEEAISQRSSNLYYGRTAMEIKSTTGAKAYPLHAYFNLSNTVLNKMVKPVVRRFTPEEWIARNPFRE
ncbi:MAG TPA: GNAT family N-acetyltransferase [Bacteroidia bacterium]|nr:GNAT family N-acetyltransferase [Bacteroidia bacterium]HRB96908.1 GNAT family N-acetyltransferase [Nitrosomonas sp.]MBP7715215.1 GNAT family N-acetyltransferase [Bacteroidia bacterium]MBP8668576.1 GNAT family N-acetyltransferase [Bacteroidia bacterium]HOZ81436.1 GNAT family N-acetyltransferase [Bacteroidia bacterium]